MGGAARPRGRDASAACRSGTTTRRATDTPHSLTGIHSATGQRWCSFSLNGPDSCSRWGRGTRATPRRARPPPAVTLQLPRPAEQGTHLKTHRRDPPVLAHLGSERETPAHRPAHPLPPPGLGVPHSPGGEKASRPPPPPRGTQEIRLYVPGEPHPAPAHRRAKRGLAPVYLAGPSGTASARARAARPSPLAPPPPSGGGLGAAAARGAEAAPRGGGRGGPRGGGGLTCATAMPAAAESLSWAEMGEGEGEGALGAHGRRWERIAARGCLGHPRESATGQVPRDLACGRPFHPRERESRTGAYPGRGVAPEASSPRLPRAALPSPAEKKPPPVSA